jgi:hypothetical protein
LLPDFGCHASALSSKAAIGGVLDLGIVDEVTSKPIAPSLSPARAAEIVRLCTDAVSAR